MEAELRSSKSRTPRKKKPVDSKWMVVLTDMLLGQLSEPSHLWRIVAEQVGQQQSSSNGNSNSSVLERYFTKRS